MIPFFWLDPKEPKVQGCTGWATSLCCGREMDETRFAQTASISFPPSASLRLTPIRCGQVPPILHRPALFSRLVLFCFDETYPSGSNGLVPEVGFSSFISRLLQQNGFFEWERLFPWNKLFECNLLLQRNGFFGMKLLFRMKVTSEWSLLFKTGLLMG